MHFALIKNNLVENIIVADDDFISNLPDYDNIVNVDEIDVGVGWEYSNKEFKRPELVQANQQVRIIHMRQFRLGLLKINKFSAFVAAISALSSPDKEEAEIEWQYATVVTRDGFINKVANVIGLSQDDLDILFNESSTL